MIISLAVATVIVTVGPSAFGFIENLSRLSAKQEWTFSQKTAERLSAERFATLYANGEIADSSSILQAENEERPDESSIKDSAKKVLRSFFSQNEELFERVSAAFDGTLQQYTKNEVLYMDEEAPVALGFVTVNFVNKEVFYEMQYEEKTGVLISMCYIESNDINVVVKGKAELLESIRKAEAYYYENLGLEPDRFCFVPSISDVEAYVSLGMKQGVDEKELYYN